MSILVDTSVWSLGLRRRKRDLNPIELRVYYEWETLIKRGEADIIGPVRQELLSGIANQDMFEALRQRINFVPALPLTLAIYDLAAEFYNLCSAAGVEAGAVDMAIAAAASHHGVPIFTTDPDFLRYALHIPIKLHATN